MKLRIALFLLLFLALGIWYTLLNNNNDPESYQTRRQLQESEERPPARASEALKAQ